MILLYWIVWTVLALLLLLTAGVIVWAIREEITAWQKEYGIE